MYLCNLYMVRVCPPKSSRKVWAVCGRDWLGTHQMHSFFLDTQLGCVSRPPLQLGGALWWSSGHTDESGYVACILILRPSEPFPMLPPLPWLWAQRPNGKLLPPAGGEITKWNEPRSLKHSMEQSHHSWSHQLTLDLRCLRNKPALRFRDVCYHRWYLLPEYTDLVSPWLQSYAWTSGPLYISRNTVNLEKLLKIFCSCDNLLL